MAIPSNTSLEKQKWSGSRFFIYLLLFLVVFSLIAVVDGQTVQYIPRKILLTKNCDWNWSASFLCAGVLVYEHSIVKFVNA